MNSSPTRRGKLTADEICDYVDQAAVSPGIQMVIFAGGEPLLLGRDLYRALRHVHESGMRSRLITNAYWANTEKTAESVVSKLRDAALDELNISIDDFHLPFIDAQNVKRAFYAALKRDFESVIIVHCSGPTTKFNDKELDELLGVRLPRMYDANQKRIEFDERGCGRPFVAVSNSAIQFIGRGAVQLRPEDLVYRDDLDSIAREHGCPWAVRSPAISPSGHLLSCCGFEVAGNEVLDIGDLHHESLDRLLSRADNDLALNAIALNGPFRLMDSMKEQQPDLPFRNRYSSVCELCQHMVTDPTLRQSFLRSLPLLAPEILAKRAAIARRVDEDLEFERLYHASDPVS
jgi:organic radical activating enzyme